jgi:hypothetical protein
VQQPSQPAPRGFRRFLTTPIGKALLIAVTILIVFAAFVYGGSDGVLLAIPAFLIFGLAAPIWAGLKRPRYLALSGLVVILLVAPISTAVITQTIYTPYPPISSCSTSNSATLCTGYPGASPVLENASVSPYSGGSSTNFTWTVNVYPSHLPRGNATVWNVSLYISTCPGATSGTSPPPWCSAGYPFTQLTRTLNLSNTSGATSPYPLQFHDVIGSNAIWDWQMGVYTLNSSTKQFYFQTLVGDPTYNGIEGPVVGSFGVTYSSVIGGIYFDVFLFLGAPFYLVLLVYVLFKGRERRRQEAQRRAAGPVPPTGGTGPGGAGGPPAGGITSGTATAGGTASATPTERSCPNCNAVVYANESKCWKCGADLTSTRASAPLPSNPPR